MGFDMRHGMAQGLRAAQRWPDCCSTGGETGRLPEELCSAILAFLPQGIEDVDEVVAVRDPAKVRTLAIMNKDLKIMCSGINGLLREHIARCACGAKRGFIRGRSLAQKVMDIDTSARVAAHVCPAGRKR